MGLLAWGEETFGTDFCILEATQDIGGGEVGRFVASTPGTVKALAGTKYALLEVRAERWDEPPPPAEGWEDVDDVPFHLRPEGPPEVQFGGFEYADLVLDLEGFARGRVRVCARGRYRYDGLDFEEQEALPPEQWLFQFYPAPWDPMLGGPRRLAGPGPSGDDPAGVAEDLNHLLRWSGGRLVASPRALAERLGLTPDQVDRGLGALIASPRRVRVEADPATASAPDPLDRHLVIAREPPAGSG